MRQLAAEEFSFDLKDLDSGALFESMSLAIRERARLGGNLKAAASELAGLAEENHLLTLKLLNGNGYKRKPRSAEAMRFLRQNVLEFIVRSDARATCSRRSLNAWRFLRASPISRSTNLKSCQPSSPPVTRASSGRKRN